MPADKKKLMMPRRGISDLKQIHAIQSPVRIALLDLIEANGPMTVAELAACLDCAMDGLYYHLKIMTKSGWFVCTTTSASRGRSKTVYDLAQRPYRLEYKPRDAKNRKAVTRIIAMLLRDALREFRRSYANRPVTSGERRNLWSGRKIAWLTSGEVEDLNRVLHRLVFGVMRTRRQRKAQAKPISFTWVLSPYGGGRRAFNRNA